jgi:hypothetical protein
LQAYSAGRGRLGSGGKGRCGGVVGERGGVQVCNVDHCRLGEQRNGFRLYLQDLPAVDFDRGHTFGREPAMWTGGGGGGGGRERERREAVNCG